MAENEQATEQAQNAQSEEQTSQSEQQEQPFKVFASRDEWSEHQDGFYRKAYNEGKSKVEKDVFNTFKEKLGVEAESLEDLVTAINPPKKQESGDNKSGETEELRNKLQEWQSKYEETQNELKQTRLNQMISAQASEAFSQVANEGKLKLDRKSIETLFKAEREIVEQDGQVYAFQDGKPELDDQGNRKTYSQSLTDFMKSKGLLEPNKQGTGGGTGGTTSGEKPSRSEWRELLRSNDHDKQLKAEELYAQYKKAGGWSE